MMTKNATDEALAPLGLARPSLAPGLLLGDPLQRNVRASDVAPGARMGQRMLARMPGSAYVKPAVASDPSDQITFWQQAWSISPAANGCSTCPRPSSCCSLYSDSFRPSSCLC